MSTVDYNLLEGIIEAPKNEVDVPCKFLCGRAGTGKTFSLQKSVTEDKSFGILCATTGIASVNLGTTTINSLLRYFDTASLLDAFYRGRLAHSIHENCRGYQWLIIDEGSMLSGQQLTLLYRGVRDANRYKDVTQPLGILLTGDFAQLPPVNAEWAFKSDYWHYFAANTTRLSHVWRQQDVSFLAAIDQVRAGHGGAAADLLDTLGACWQTARDGEFDGTTIVPVNTLVSRHNEVALDRVSSKRITVSSRRWGQERKEWGFNKRSHEWGIPPASEYKIGAYVMILSNDLPEFNFANGDCGHIVDYDEAAQKFTVKLARNGKDVTISRIVRATEQADRPLTWQGEQMSFEDDDSGWFPRPHYRTRVQRYILGQIEYFPMRLAYASTVHKSQGLSLDKVQLDFRHWFFGNSNMLYVGLSRVRTMEGLRLVGTKDKFIKQCKLDVRVREYL